MIKKNKTMMQFFEWYLPADSTHWKKTALEASKLKSAGITCVWLPPAYKGASGVTDVGYAVYDLYDLGEFDQKGTVATKYGTKDEYLMAIKELKKNNIEVLADIVLGHRMGADEKERIFAYGQDEYNRNVEVAGKRKITVWTRFTFPGRNGKYSDFKWDWTNFHGTDFDAKSQENGIYRFIGKEWDSDVDGEFGNYDYLMGVDLDMSDEEVLEELDRWGKWYFEFTGVDGFRLDAVKHIDFSFYRNWLKKLRTEFNKPIFAVGEYWNAELNILENYIEKTEGSLSLFDVPLHFNMYHASRSNGYYDMRYILKNTLLSSRKELSVTFVDNHDTQPGQALESNILEWFKPHAYALILLRHEGYPCVFYGDYYGIEHDNIPPVKDLPVLMKLRQYSAYGIQHDYFNHEKIVGWTLEGVNELKNSGLAVIMTVEKRGSKKMYVGKHFAGTLFVDALKNVSELVKIDEDGYGIFKVNDGSVSVYRPKIGQIIGIRDDEEFHDETEVSAYAKVENNVEPKLVYGSNYKHMNEGEVQESNKEDLEQ
ncbi:MAG: alpha-amylase [Lachnospiraceae bacterium]|nr:alpha-amylase [Lachnospiraceae bacterium]